MGKVVVIFLPELDSLEFRNEFLNTGAHIGVIPTLSYAVDGLGKHVVH